MSDNIQIRAGQKQDIEQVYSLIRDLAEHEEGLQELENTPQRMLKDGFGEKPLFEFFVAESEEEIIAMALYYYRYSTWKGKVLYLEDLFVKPEYRKKGLAYKLFQELVNKAKSENCSRISWQVLEWNKEAIKFYKKIGAGFDGEWLNSFLTKEQFEGF